MAHPVITAELERWRPRGWDVLHDVSWPGGHGGTSVDHVAVGPGGVIVVDDHDWAPGASTAGGVLVSEGHRRSGECRGVAARVSGVSALLLPAHRTATRGALALVRQPMPAMLVEAGTVVVGRPDLDAWRAGLPRVLDPGDVVAASEHLRGVLASSPPPVQLTLQGFLAGRG